MEKPPRYFTIKQFTRIVFEMTHAVVKYSKYMRLVDKVFNTEIMLAVSGVNKCAICSHVHTKTLLKKGARASDLEDLYAHVSEEKRLALAFAEHYADETGNYAPEAFNQLVIYYGHDQAYGIMAVIKMIMFGNANGIALTNLGNRLRFKRNKESRFLTELYNGPFAYLLMLILFIVNIFTKRKVY